MAVKKSDLLRLFMIVENEDLGEWLYCSVDKCISISYDDLLVPLLLLSANNNATSFCQVLTHFSSNLD